MSKTETCPVCKGSFNCFHCDNTGLSTNARRLVAEAKVVELVLKLNSPELLSFRDGVLIEAVHQRERWGSTNDAGKEPSDWFWLIGYLAGKALAAHIKVLLFKHPDPRVISEDYEKALHHTISAAAALANWHAAILGKTNMRPGTKFGEKEAACPT